MTCDACHDTGWISLRRVDVLGPVDFATPCKCREGGRYPEPRAPEELGRPDPRGHELLPQVRPAKHCEVSERARAFLESNGVRL